MTAIFLALAAGTLLGYLLRYRTRLFHLAGHVSSVSVLDLLFLLGLSVGANEAITGNMVEVGLQALLLSLAGIGGSVLLAWTLYRLVFRSSENEK